MRYCNSCEFELPDASLFCFKCGRKVGPGGQTGDSTGRRSFWPERFGPALVEGEVGKGGMAVVFRARHEKLGIPVAVKAMSISSPVGDVERFRREARVCMSLSNQGIVKVYDFGEVDGFFYMIQEFVEGEDLRKRLSRRSRFPWWEAVMLTLEIAQIIAYIHGCGIIHRDLKPANIFVPWRGGVKIGDFGLASDGDDTVEDERLTVAGLAIGSPAYMPPEQFRDTSSVDERGDLYALGVTMFELLCGEPPFRSKKVSALRDMHQSEHRPRPSERVPGIPEAIDEVVLKLMARDPLERYQSAGELIAALEELVRTHDIASIAEQKRSNRRTTKTYKTIVVPSGVDALEDEEAELDDPAHVRLPPGYRLLHPMSRGVFWANYLVHHIESGQDLVLWLLDRDEVPTEVPNKIKADLLKIGAANVRGFNGAIAVGDIDDKIFAASFANDGESFAEIVNEEGLLPEDKAVPLIQDLNLTLRPLHEAGISLRGIRPERLYRDTSTGKTSIDVVATIICDEGLVSSSRFDDSVDLAFLAPERYDGMLPAGSATSDIFAIGAVLYYMMTGQLIHEESDPRTFMEAVRRRQIRSLREILGDRCSRPVSDALKRCLADDPSRRFPSLEAFTLALRGRRRPSVSGRYKPRAPVNLSSFVGLDLGAAAARIATLSDDGRPRVVVGPDGQQVLPSVVHASGRGPGVVGEQALMLARKQPLGLHRNFLNNVLDDSDGEHPVALAAVVARHLVRRVRAASGDVPREAVIAVPTMFGDRERYCLRIAGELAGLKVLGLIPDTTAAALTYAFLPQAKPTLALVVDMGTRSLSVAIIQIRGGNIQVLAADGLRDFGGDSWNDRLAEVLAAEVQTATGVDPRADPVGRLFLDEQVEKAKRILSTRTRARVLVAAGKKVERQTLSRGRFDELTRDLMQRLASVLETVLEKSNLAWSDIERVLAVGGATRMPAVNKLIWRVTGRIPDSGVDHTTAVAEGATYYALKVKNQRGDRFMGKPGQIAGKILIRNVTPYSLGVVVETRGRTVAHTIIPEQNPLPAKETKIFALTADKDQTVTLKLVEGDARAGAMRPLGTMTLSELPPGDGEPVRISTTYLLSEDGQLRIEARDARTGRPVRVSLDRELVPGSVKLKEALAGRVRDLLGAGQSSGQHRRPRGRQR